MNENKKILMQESIKLIKHFNKESENINIKTAKSSYLIYVTENAANFNEEDWAVFFDTTNYCVNRLKTDLKYWELLLEKVKHISTQKESLKEM